MWWRTGTQLAWRYTVECSQSPRMWRMARLGCHPSASAGSCCWKPSRPRRGHRPLSPGWHRITSTQRHESAAGNQLRRDSCSAQTVFRPSASRSWTETLARPEALSKPRSGRSSTVLQTIAEFNQSLKTGSPQRRANSALNLPGPDQDSATPPGISLDSLCWLGS